MFASRRTHTMSVCRVSYVRVRAKEKGGGRMCEAEEGETRDLMRQEVREENQSQLKEGINKLEQVKYMKK